MTSNYPATVNAFYLAFYGRPADPEGLAFWSMQLDRTHGDFSQLIDAFANTEESAVRFHGNTTEERITTIYQQLFDRMPDAEGLAFWVGAVDGGATTLAAVSLDMQRSAQGSDIAISMLRQQAAADFTQLVSAGGIAFDGFAAVEASRALVAAVKADTSVAEVAALVKAAGMLVDVVHATPAVLAALGVDGQLAPLFSTTRGQAEPGDLLRALADVANAAAGNPATLDSLLRGGGMAKVLTVMPAGATLRQVVDALAKGGLPAAIDIVYPTDPTPAPDVSLNIKYDAETHSLILTGNALYSATVDLDAHKVVYNGKIVQVKGDIAAVVSTSYPGAVMLSGSVAVLSSVLAHSAGVDTYRVVDVKSALFTGPLESRVLVKAAVELIKGADTVLVKDVLSEAEHDLLANLEGFDLRHMVAEVDTQAPAAGTLHFFVGGEALPDNPAINHGSFDITAVGHEAGARVIYQVADGHGGWNDLVSASPSGLNEGNYSYRAVVVDAAGNLSYGEAATIVIDMTAPSVSTLVFDSNDGSLAVDESVELSVSFSEKVYTEGTSLALNNGASAVYVRGSGTTTLVFKYTPAAGESISGLQLAPTYSFGGHITDRAGNALAPTAFLGKPISGDVEVDTDVPAQAITFASISQSGGNGASLADVTMPLSTNLASATVYATLSAALQGDEHIEFSLDDGQNWSAQGVSTNGTQVSVSGVRTTTNPTVSLRVVDAAGNAGAPVSHAIAYDNVAPLAGTLRFVGLEMTGSGSVTSDDTFSLELDGAEVGAQVVYQVRASGQDAWTALASTSLSGLADGGYSYRALVTDAAGNVSQTMPIFVAIDKTAPVVGTIAFAANDGALALGESVELTVSFDAEVTVSDTPTIRFNNGGSAIYQSGSGTDHLVFKYTPATGQSTSSLALAVSGIVDGSIVDGAGNAVTDSGLSGAILTGTPTVDVVAPTQLLTITTISQSGGDSSSVAGTTNPLATNLASATVRATLSATLGQDEHVEYSIDGGQHWSAQGVGTVGTAVTVADVATAGSPNLMLRAVDAAGNAGTVVSRPIVYSTTLPTVGPFDIVSIDQGLFDSVDDNVTNVPVPRLTFHRDGNWQQAGTTLQFSVDGQNWSNSIASSPGDMRYFYADISKGVLGLDGNRTTTVQVRVIDAAGNYAIVTSKDVVYDNSAAAPSVALVTDTGTPGDRVTTVGDVSVGGLEQGASWEYKIDNGAWVQGGAIDGQGKSVMTVTDFGAHTVLVHQRDAAGNMSQDSILDFTLQSAAAPVTTEVTSLGINVSSSVGGAVYLVPTQGTPVVMTSGGIPIIVPAGGSAQVGAQSSVVGGTLAVKNANSDYIADASGAYYVLGTSAAEPLYGKTGFNNVIVSFGGGDYLAGQEGNDSLYGGAGNDTLSGGAGEDYLYGGAGSNNLTGGAGADRIDITLGRNSLNFQTGDSVASGYDVVTFAADASSNFNEQTFRFASLTVANVTKVISVANPVDASAGALTAALSAAYQLAWGTTSRDALIVEFQNQDKYLVVDTGNGLVEANDYVIKLVGAIDYAYIGNGNVVFSHSA